MDEKSLVIAEKLDVAVLFTGDGMNKILKDIEAKAMAHVPDVSTDIGRKDIASLAHKVARSKTLIDDLGKDMVADWKKKAKSVDEHRKTARDFLDGLKERVRQPLTDWEAVEAEKKAESDRLEKEKIDERIAELAKWNKHLPFFDVAGMTNEIFADVLLNAKTVLKAEQKRLADEEASRRAETERLKKVAEEQAVEHKKIEDEHKAIEAEKKALEDARRAEQERKNREAFEAQAKEEARIATEKAAAEKVEREVREAKEKAEREADEKARAEALRPDREKLEAWAKMIADIPLPDMSDQSMIKIAKEARTQLFVIARNIIKATKEL